MRYGARPPFNTDVRGIQLRRTRYRDGTRNTIFFNRIVGPEHLRFGIGEIALEDMRFPELPQQDRTCGRSHTGIVMFMFHSSSKSLASSVVVL